MSVSFEQRSEGMLLGTAVGDLMGSPFEGYDITASPNKSKLFKGYKKADPEDPTQSWKRGAAEMILSIRRKPGMLATSYIGHLGTGFWEYGETTDDTAQTIALTKSLIVNNGIDPADVAERLVDWYDGGLGRGMGGTTALSLQLMDPQEVYPPFSWDEASALAKRLTSKQPLHYKGRSHQRPYPVWAVPSNGALMRVSPIGIAFKNAARQRRQAAKDVTAITHNFQQCIDASVFQVDLISQLAKGVSKDEAIAKVSERYPEVVAAAQDALTQTTDELGHTGGAMTTLGVALESFSQTDTFADAIISAINSTVLRKFWMSDIDTYAAVTGALAGTHYGVESIPREWYKLQHPEGGVYNLQPHSAAKIRKLGRKLAQVA